MAGGLLGQADAGPAAPPMVAPPPRRAVSVRVPASSLAELRCLSGLGRIIKVSAQIVCTPVHSTKPCALQIIESFPRYASHGSLQQRSPRNRCTLSVADREQLKSLLLPDDVTGVRCI